MVNKASLLIVRGGRKVETIVKLTQTCLKFCTEQSILTISLIDGTTMYLILARFERIRSYGNTDENWLDSVFD